MSSCSKSLKPSGFNEILCTSDITCYDGAALQCVSVTANANLNQVLSAIDQAICDIITGSSPLVHDAADITYTGDTTFTCFTMVATDVESAIEELADEICSLYTTVDNLCTDDIDLCSVDFSCLTARPWFPSPVPTDVTGFANWVITTFCDIDAKINSGGLGGGGSDFPQELVVGLDLTDMSNRMTRTGGGNSSWVYLGGDILSAGGSYVVTIHDVIGTGFSEYIIEGWWVEEADGVLPALPASMDNYIDIQDDGTFLVTSVALAAPPPAVPANSMRLWKAVTDGSGVASTTDLRNIYAHDGTTFSDDSILTRHITDLNVTNGKLDTVVTAATEGDSDFFEIIYNNKGRITASSSKVVIAGLADNDILQYDLGADEWQNMAIAGSILPAAVQNETLYYDAGAWAAASNFVNTGTEVGVGVNSGEPQQGMTFGDSISVVKQLPQVTGVAASTAGGGTLAADTYYYVVVCYDGNSETVISTEVNESVDGAVTTAIDLSWTGNRFAYRYRVYKGIATGVYTEYFETREVTYTDDGTAGTVGAPVSITDTFAYGFVISGSGIAAGIAPPASGVFFTLNNIDVLTQTTLEVTQNAVHDAVAPIDVWAGKFTTNVANTTNINIGIEGNAENSATTNIGGKFTSVTSVAGDNYGLWLDALNGGAGDAWSLWVERGNVGIKANIIMSDAPATVITSTAAYADFAIYQWKDWNERVSNNVVNDTSGVDAAAAFVAGSRDGATDVWGESASMSYFSPTYVRGGAPTTGTGFYQNKAVFTAGVDTDGMVIANENATDLHFEMDFKSKMIIQDTGEVGIGIDDAGATAVTAGVLLELVSTTQGFLPPKMTGAQATTYETSTPPDGVMIYATSTNGTFASIGFWGKVNGTFVALH